MFGIGMPEFIVIAVVAIVVIGPKKLPEVARTLGKAMGEFKRATNELRSAVNIDDDLSEVKQTFQEAKNATYDSIYSQSEKSGEDDTADSAPAPDDAAGDDGSGTTGRQDATGADKPDASAEEAHPTAEDDALNNNKDRHNNE
ncbi:MAG: Sec-independent protein translocase protein TatB [Thermodesulfobacteriota bacterium]|nr:Sec-independent protein translocase protein TatB [Thermodesulfobacteriota bacterium]